jgi:hypothetical protein
LVRENSHQRAIKPGGVPFLLDDISKVLYDGLGAVEAAIELALRQILREAHFCEIADEEAVANTTEVELKRQVER